MPDIAAVVGKLTYRPGWSFEVYETEAQGMWLAINAVVEDAYTPGAQVPLRIKSQLPPFQDEAQLLRWLRWRLEVIETHECHEWLRDKGTGRPLWDPHADGADEPMHEVAVPAPRTAANKPTFPLPIPDRVLGYYDQPAPPGRHAAPDDDEPTWTYRHPALDGMSRR